MVNESAQVPLGPMQREVETDRQLRFSSSRPACAAAGFALGTGLLVGRFTSVRGEASTHKTCGLFAAEGGEAKPTEE